MPVTDRSRSPSGAGNAIPATARIHRAWTIVAIAAAAIMAAGAFSTMPGLLVDPLHHDFQWSHGTTGFAMWVNMLLNGLMAPFAAALMDRFGLRRVAIGAMLIIAAGAGLSTVMTATWQFVMYWGVMIGLGTGAMGGTFAATVTKRWFVRRRGLATGVLTASSVFGQFVFLPFLAFITEHHQWRASAVTVAIAALTVVPFIWLLLREYPADVAIPAYGAEEVSPPTRPHPNAFRRTFQVLGRAAHTGTFWLLTGTFAICGISTNGMMWTHFVPAAGDHGMQPTTAASLLTMIGVFNVVGTVTSGWLTDRYDPRLLLAAYYALRASTLLLLPMILGPQIDFALVSFVILFGLLDVATVPPTIALSAIRNTFGQEDSAIIFGWTLAAHQAGAGLMAFTSGMIRDAAGTYTMAWFSASMLCVVAALMALAIRRPAPRRPQAATAYHRTGSGKPSDLGDHGRQADRD